MRLRLRRKDFRLETRWLVGVNWAECCCPLWIARVLVGDWAARFAGLGTFLSYKDSKKIPTDRQIRCSFYILYSNNYRRRRRRHHHHHGKGLLA
jgi:hypothetical protein